MIDRSHGLSACHNSFDKIENVEMQQDQNGIVISTQTTALMQIREAVGDGAISEVKHDVM